MHFALYLLLLHLPHASPDLPAHFPTRSLHWVAADTTFGLVPATNPIQLSSAEITSLKALMSSARRSWNKNRSRPSRIRPLRRYQFQCFAYLDPRGHRRVFVQGIQAPRVDTDHFTRVLDGGNSVITIRIDLTQKQVTGVGINGVG